MLVYHGAFYGKNRTKIGTIYGINHGKNMGILWNGQIMAHKWCMIWYKIWSLSGHKMTRSKIWCRIWAKYGTYLVHQIAVVFKCL